jgi:RIO-like serine/threonine protein kinase
MTSQTRKCYVLTSDIDSDRGIFCKNILETIGFEVILFKFIPYETIEKDISINDKKVLSNKLSMLEIYKLIANGNDNWVYVFEDDINILEYIEIDEIIEYEKISNMFFYLGLCCMNNNKNISTPNEINNHIVIQVSGQIRGLHAIGISKQGAKELIDFTENYENFIYMDMILEKFSEKYPANVVRFDLQSYIKGHRGIFYQDRERFPSTI